MEENKQAKIDKARNYTNQNKDITLEDCVEYCKSLNMTAGDYLTFCIIFPKYADVEYFKSLEPNEYQYYCWCFKFPDDVDHEYYIATFNPTINKYLIFISQLVRWEQFIYHERKKRIKHKGNKT